MYALKHAMRLMLYEDYRYARALIYGESIVKRVCFERKLNDSLTMAKRVVN